MKIIYLDTETTGANPDKHAIWEVAGIIEIDGKPVEEFEFLMRPFEGAEFDRKVMIQLGVDKKAIMSYDPPDKVHQDFLEMLGSYVDKFNPQDKFHMVGYFSFFDDKFLRAWFQRMGDDYYGSWFFAPPIDLAILAQAVLMNHRHTLKNFKLGTVAAYMGIEVDESQQHRALYDTWLTKKLWDEVRKNITQL